ncbi:MAG: MFS transporter [Candidatus Odinarchaeota archaeon]
MMSKLSENNTLPPGRAINLASIVSLLSSIQLMTFNTYVVIYLEADLLVAVIIITIIMSARNFLQLFLRIPLGELSQVIGRKPLILFGHFSFSTAILLLFFARDWVLVFVGVIFIAVGMSAFWPALFAYIGDFSDKSGSFGENNGRIFRTWDIGIIIASLTAKILLDVISMDLQDIFLIIGSFGFISGLVAILILPEGLLEEQRKQVASLPRALYGSLTSMFASLVKITREKGMLEIYAFQFIIAFLEFMMMTFFPVLVVARGFSRGNVAEIAFWATLVLLWFKPYLGRVTDRIPFSSLTTVMLVISSIAVLLITAASELWLFVCLYIVYSGCIITTYTAANGETARRAPAAYRGVSLGVLGFYVASGRTVSTVLLGPIWDLINLEAVFYIGTLISLISSIALFILYSRNNHKTAKKLPVAPDDGKTADMSV